MITCVIPAIVRFFGVVSDDTPRLIKDCVATGQKCFLKVEYPCSDFSGIEQNMLKNVKPC